ncbi:MAG: peroxiredoxin [Xylanivirga thermophila]|jgi:peroxiredoxin 2/4|uniref:peroxiredoxin n=1 Tax=Xylanivirga thermophila TaxID=2496273 RepID=UPI00101CB966|nr:peroxiredoxin [Xylanivirga thermophila]
MEDVKRMALLGEKFPSMEVVTTHGVKKLPDDYAGKWFVLFSHPGDFTPVCTTEFVSFSKKADEFKKLNTELIGLSVDQVFSHIKWIEWIKDKTDVEVPFPVIADELGRTASALGMIHPSKGTNTVRAVFIVDDKGVVRLIMYYPQEVGRNVDEVLRSVKALQTADKNKVAVPENWPNNPLIGDKVIIPPVATEKLAKERLEQAQNGEIECFDWWFCYKKL